MRKDNFYRFIEELVYDAGFSEPVQPEEEILIEDIKESANWLWLSVLRLNEINIRKEYLTPTQLGLLLEPKISAQKINKLLEKHNLQIRDDNKTWQPISIGLEFSIYLEKGIYNSKVLLWSPEVLDYIDQESLVNEL
jgi:hypothetical protein